MEKVTENSSFMYTIWLVLALICMGYYIVCATYAGVGSSFIFIWLLGAVFFGLVFAVRVLEIKGIIHVANASVVFSPFPLPPDTIIVVSGLSIA